MSENGSRVAFASGSSDLVPSDPNGTIVDIYVAALDTSDMTDVHVVDMLRVSTDEFGLNNGGGANAHSAFPDISASGRFVAFDSNASDLVPDDANGQVRDIFVAQIGQSDGGNLQVTDIVLVSTDIFGRDDGNGANGTSDSARISPAGRYTVFQSEASDLVTDDANGTADVFIFENLLAP